MPNFVRHTPITFEQMGSTIRNCNSIEDAARRAFKNQRYDDPVAFIRETNGRTVVAFARIQDDDGSMTIRELDSFFLGKKTGGKIPLDTVPDRFITSARKIFKSLVVNPVVSGQIMDGRSKRRVVRSDASRRLAYSVDALQACGRVDDLYDTPSRNRLTTRSSNRLIGY